MDQKRNLLVFAISVVVVASIIFCISLIDNSSPIDNAPFEGENPNSAEQAILTGGEVVFKEIQDVQTYERLSHELYVFGKTAFSHYFDAGNPMGFKIESTVREGEKIMLTGRYGQSDNQIQISFVKLNDNQITISITDLETGLNFDPYLASNQLKNQLIGKLPIDETGYSIRYLEDRDTFVINTFNDPTNYTKAVGVIQDSLGDELFSYQKIVRYGAGDVQIENRF
jgi:hypothetical protein